MKVAIPTAFTTAGDFCEGRAWIEVGGRYGYIDTAGKVILEPRFSSARDFCGGLALVDGGFARSGDAEWPPTAGYIDRQGLYVWRNAPPGGGK